MATRYTNLPNLKDKKYGGAYSVYDAETCRARNEALGYYAHAQNSLDPEQVKREFLDTYKQWMFSTHPKIKGWQEYNELCFTQGTTESFAQFYLRYRNDKRLRLAKGEYFYSQMMKGLWYSDNFAWLDEDDIKEGDVLLISVPFSDTGAIPNGLENILSECDKKQVPVMLDLAYINLAVDMELDLTHTCIEYVVSSLSKVFPIELYRVGIRMQRKKLEDQLYVVNEKDYNYINLMSAYLGTVMMKKFSADYIYKKYLPLQKEMCEELGLEPSPCVYFGIDRQNRYPEYTRGTTTNRLCFTRVWDGRM